MLLAVARRMLPGGGPHHEHISALQIRDTRRGTLEWKPVEDLVEMIDHAIPVQLDPLYVRVAPDQAEIKTVHRPGWKPFLRTAPDGTLRDNLLALPVG